MQTETQAKTQTAAQPQTAVEIEAAQAAGEKRRAALTSQLDQARLTEAELRAEFRRAAADGQPTAEIKTRLESLGAEIAEAEAGLSQVQADAQRLSARLQAATVAEARAAHAAALSNWGALLDDLDGDLCAFYRERLAARLSELSALEQEIYDAESTLRAHSSRMTHVSAVEMPQQHGGRSVGRARSMVRGLADYEAGKPYQAMYALPRPDAARNG